MNKRVLEKFFDNEASRAEVEQVLSWFKEKQLDPEKIQSLEEFWHQMDESDLVSHDRDQLLHSIHRQIEKNTRPSAGRKIGTDPKVFNLSYWGKVAAVLFFIGIAAWGGTHWFSDARSGTEKWISRKTAAGEKIKLTLSDGTLVHLNAESKITFPAEFGSTKRFVSLRGEAFFEVKKDTSRPFIIRTQELSARVLGTSFNVRSYQSGEHEHIALVTGRLEVIRNSKKGKAEPYILAPGEAAVFDKTNKTIKKTGFDSQVRLGWLQGRLIFEDADIHEVITRLERWYGVTIEVINREKAVRQQWSYRGIFKNDSIREVLKGMSYVKGFTFEIRGNRVKIIL